MLYEVITGSLSSDREETLDGRLSSVGVRILGHGGTDTIYGSDFDDDLFGGEGNDKIYGPSGCGKSSLVRAGLLPRLSDDVTAVYLEATAIV